MKLLQIRSVAFALTIAFLAAGCASPWEANFEPNPALAGAEFAPTEAVQVRTIEFERLQRYAAAERAIRVQSTTAPEDLSAAEKLRAKNRLLETLQLPERGDGIEVLGWSEFTHSQRLDPRDPQLQKFARGIGADYVVIASDYAGTVTRTVERPMTTYSRSYTTVSGGVAARRRGAPVVVTHTDSSTTWVPMNVIEDQYVYTAAFLRKARPGEP